MKPLSSITIVRVALAFAVAFWMAGAGCMFGCENMLRTVTAADSHASAHESILVASGDACASMGSHDCCAKRGRKSVAAATKKSGKSHAAPIDNAEPAQFVTEQFEATSSGMFDCPLAINANAALTKPGPDQSSVALLSQGAAPAVANASEQTISFARPLRLPNRGHPYL